MQKIILILIGGALGAVLRYGLSGLIHRIYVGGFPYGTLVVNTLGCFVLGFLATISSEKFLLSSNMRTFIFIGLLGAFTTFSTFTYESMMFLKDGEIFRGASNILCTFVLCFLFFIVGSYIAKII